MRCVAAGGNGVPLLYAPAVVGVLVSGTTLHNSSSPTPFAIWGISFTMA